MDVKKVVLTELAKKSLLKLPFHIVKKLQSWVDEVETDGLIKTRRVPGYHDEPLKGKRLGQRSIRLSRAYRAIYIIDDHGSIKIISVLEVSKHDY